MIGREADLLQSRGIKEWYVCFSCGCGELASDCCCRTFSHCRTCGYLGNVTVESIQKYTCLIYYSAVLVQ